MTDRLCRDRPDALTDITVSLREDTVEEPFQHRLQSMAAMFVHLLRLQETLDLFDRDLDAGDSMRRAEAERSGRPCSVASVARSRFAG